MADTPDLEQFSDSARTTTWSNVYLMTNDETAPLPNGDKTLSNTTNLGFQAVSG